MSKLFINKLFWKFLYGHKNTDFFGGGELIWQYTVLLLALCSEITSGGTWDHMRCQGSKSGHPLQGKQLHSLFKKLF